MKGEDGEVEKNEITDISICVREEREGVSLLAVALAQRCW